VPDESVASPNTHFVINLEHVPEAEFDAKRALRVAAMRGDRTIVQTAVTPAESENPRRIEVRFALGPWLEADGAQLLVAPDDAEPSQFRLLALRRSLASLAGPADRRELAIGADLYRYWQIQRAARTHRITGRVLRREGRRELAVGGARVEIFDVDYLWWWYGQQQLAVGYCDPCGYFDITIDPGHAIWRMAEPAATTNEHVDRALRDQLLRIAAKTVPLQVHPVPGSPEEWHERLTAASIDLSGIPAQQGNTRAFTRMRGLRPVNRAAFSLSSACERRTACVDKGTLASWRRLFGGLISWPPAGDPCDWRPDVKICATQEQDGERVQIYSDDFENVRWGLAGDVLNLRLVASERAQAWEGLSADPRRVFSDAGWHNAFAVYPVCGDAARG